MSTRGGRTRRERPYALAASTFYAALVVAIASGAIPRTFTPRGTIGAAVILLAILLMAWSSFALRSWRLLAAIDTGHELCTTGPYAHVRHPMYVAVDLLALGSAVWVPTRFVIVGALLLFVGGDLRARAEEKVLVEAFGRSYLELHEASAANAARDLLIEW